MKASTYQRRHEGELPDAILEALQQYHGCYTYMGPNSPPCLADQRRTDLVMDLIEMHRPLP